jgi:hypothetical protein
MKKLKWIFFIVFVLGFITLILPDNGEPVFKLNRMHGPSTQDLVGLILIFIAWYYSFVIIFNEEQSVVEKIGRKNVSLLIIVYIISLLGVAAGLSFSLELVLWASVFVASMINMLFIAAAFVIKK